MHNPPTPKIILDSPHIWAHRVNTLERFDAAIKAEVRGIEVDVFFDSTSNKFYVCHDFPCPKNSLTLKNILESLPLKTYIWIDFKNLTLSNAQKSLNHLASILQASDKEFSQVIVESRNAFALSSFRDKKLLTALWPDLSTKSSIFYLRLLFYKAIMWVYKFDFISAYYTAYEEMNKAYFKSWPTLVFTINDDKIIDDFKNYKNINAILTDNY